MSCWTRPLPLSLPVSHQKAEEAPRLSATVFLVLIVRTATFGGMAYRSPSLDELRLPIDRDGSRAIRADIAVRTTFTSSGLWSPSQGEQQTDEKAHANTPCLLYVLTAPAKAGRSRHHADTVA